MHVSPTILAIASSPGRSLRGIIRISGPECFATLQPHLKGVKFTRGANKTRLAISTLPAFGIWAFVFPSPNSYTGEDSIELQLPGNPMLLERVIAALLESARQRSIDARRAQPGEFTARAYLNGRLSLTQAEGVAATIAAQSDAELAAARLLSTGRLGDFAHALADDIAAALALVESGIDFTDQEDVVAITSADLNTRLVELRHRLSDQLEHAVGLEQLRAIPWVALMGETNAGKSALFNALLGRERAVVSPVSGTTRDVLTEPLAIDTSHGKAEVMLVDLAGLDELDQSPMNALMQARAREALDRAELRLRCVPVDQDAGASRPDEILVRTKSDLLSEDEVAKLRESSSGIAVSACTDAGLKEFRSAIGQALASRAVSLAAGALALQPRHEAAMKAALASIDEAIALTEPFRARASLQNPEIVAAAMRAALDDLASLAGDLTPDDILGRIFATFCVGK